GRLSKSAEELHGCTCTCPEESYPVTAPGQIRYHETRMNMNQDIHASRILILDFGSQYTQLIARRVREIGVYCEIYPFDMSEADIRAFKIGRASCRERA